MWNPPYFYIGLFEEEEKAEQEKKEALRLEAALSEIIVSKQNEQLKRLRGQNDLNPFYGKVNKDKS